MNKKAVVFMCFFTSWLFAHEAHNPEESKAERTKSISKIPYNILNVELFNWDAPNLVGIPATKNVADLPRTHKKNNYFATHNPAYGGCLYDSKVSQYKDSDLHYINRLLINHKSRGSIREAPFPEIMCFIHETDYYKNRTLLQKKIEKYVDENQDKRQEVLNNYIWALLYFGEFEYLIYKFQDKGTYGILTKNSPSMQFALSQAYFRLGKYKKSYQHGLVAYEELSDSILDTRWHLMLVELGILGENYFDFPDSPVYNKSSIKKLFPKQKWSEFPFKDVTKKMGIDRWGGTGSVSFVDLDLDSWDELVWERKFMPPQIYKNLKGKQFKPIPQKNLPASLGTSIIFTAGDVNNDGLPDFFRHCCNYDGEGPTQVLLNKGQLEFEDITKTSGLEYSQGSGMVVAWSDYDLDGLLDLVIADNYGPNRLYRNLGNNRFEDTTKRAGLVSEKTVGISFGDYNDDGWPDVWAQGWDVKWLYRNNKDGTFTNVTQEAGLNENLGQKGYMSFMFDYNNDGLNDLFAGQYVVSSDEKWGFGPICSCSNLLSDTGYSEREWRSATTIYKNNGNGTFTNMSEYTRFIPLGMMGSNHGDWNNDGFEDLIFGTGGPYMQQAEPLLFYLNNGDDTFTNITPFDMLPLFGKGHGSAFTDFNHDGFLDVASNNGGAAPGDLWPGFLLENKGNDNNWLYIKLKPISKNINKLAIGAKVTLYRGNKIQTKEVQTGGQFGATNSLTLHFGLGKSSHIDRIEIRWPNRIHDKTIVYNVKVNQSIEISQNGNIKELWKKEVAIRE